MSKGLALPPRLAGDPLGPVLALGGRELRFGIWLGLLGALLLHAVAVGQAAFNLLEVEQFARDVARHVRSGLQMEVDIDVTEPPPPPPPPPEAPPPEPEAPPPPVPAEAPPPREAPPAAPAPAEAGKVLTQEPDPNEPVDLTADGFISGTGDRFAGGVTSSNGTSQTAVRDTRAVPGGVPGGTGTAVAPPAPTGPDLSRSASPVGTSWSECGFPAEAELDGVDYGLVTLVVSVGADGRARSVSIIKDPGSGFGPWTKKCALRRMFQPALDRSGKAIASTTAPFTVKFTR